MFLIPVRYLEHVTVNVTIGHMARGELEVCSPSPLFQALAPASLSPSLPPSLSLSLSFSSDSHEIPCMGLVVQDKSEHRRVFLFTRQAGA
jgi:hypothetical protein